MKLHRFIIEGIELQTGHVRIHEAGFVDQIKNVLKLGLGEQMIVGDGHGMEARIRLTQINKGAIEGEVLRVYQNENEPEIHAILYCSLLKRENFEWVVQKATEAGVFEIVPVIAERTVKLNLKKERLTKIMQEAAEQSERGRVPIIHEAVSLMEALRGAKSNTANLFFDKSGTVFNGKRDLGVGKIGIFIGPEGGWSEEEIHGAKESGCAVVRLSALTLRAETAALLSVYLVSHFDSLFKASR